LTNHIYGAMYLMINNNWFKSLPADYQNALIIAGREAAITARGMNRIMEANGLEYLRERGMEIVTPAPAAIEEMRKLAQPPVIEMLKKQYGAAWVDEILNAVK